MEGGILSVDGVLQLPSSPLWLAGATAQSIWCKALARVVASWPRRGRSHGESRGDGGKLDATSQHITRLVTRRPTACDLVQVERQWRTALDAFKVTSLYKPTGCCTNHTSRGAIHDSMGPALKTILVILEHK